MWRTAGLPEPRPLLTAFTLGLGSEEETRHKARGALRYPLLKLKVDAERHLDVVRIVREEHPQARLIVDANESWSRDLLEKLLPTLAALNVELIEQPVPQGEMRSSTDCGPPVPLAADESCTDRASLDALAGRYGYVNIKLDKCGGLTEALLLAGRGGAAGISVDGGQYVRQLSRYGTRGI